MRREIAETQLGELAARQHGVVARRQLAALGLSASAVDRRIRAGRLHPVHRGVYAVGHRLLSRDGWWMADVLACGAGAVIGYRSAATLWNLRRSPPRLTDVIVPRGGGRTRSRVRVHRHPGLLATEVTRQRGIPVTTTARTILDLAAATPEGVLKRALDRAELLELTDYPALDALARARPHHQGSARLRRMLQEHEAGTARTRSDLEVAFLDLCEQHGLPRPLVNEPLCGITVDFVFAAHRVAVETDSWAWHRGRAAFERDRERDALLATAAYRTLRFTDRQIELAPRTVVDALTAALTRSAPELGAPAA